LAPRIAAGERRADVLAMSGIRFDEEAACEQCGRFGAYQFDGKLLCAECYEQHGSCCPEFEGRKAPEERERVCAAVDAKQGNES
jgi:hypothetical protein